MTHFDDVGFAPAPLTVPGTAAPAASRPGEEA